METQPTCNAEILFKTKEQGEIVLPNEKANKFKTWMNSRVLKFEYITKGELTTIKLINNI